VLSGKLILILILAGLALFLFSMYRRCKRPVRTFLTTAVLGLLFHIGVSFASQWTGVPLAVNGYTVACSSLLSLPGVILMLVLRLV